ncbi:Glutamine--fructose-6-phosphate aminotransferase [isomerizing] [Candidatus Calditenuaceae archaeon HR02]|nr:Glutamine--fructose-6-phosphate aminotransferase [isomerizing] [Candidatus Calditenuaceae archaeon HR02]
MRKAHSRPIPSTSALNAIECVRYRGSKMGAGFARVRLDTTQGWRVKAFAVSEEVALQIFSMLEEKWRLEVLSHPTLEYTSPNGGLASYTACVEAGYEALWRAVQEVNRMLWSNGFKGRIYSWGRFVDVYKGVGYPVDVYSLYQMGDGSLEADLWIAHTRQPTNSPGRLPVWSHPFSSGDWAIVHNGDISSFGSNMEFLWSLGYKSFVGTDSEVIAYLLDYLTSFQHLNVQEAVKILCNRFNRGLPDPETVKLLYKWRGARLDGPFSVIGGFCDGHDVYMVAFADRFKFRPIIVGEDENYIYAASEEAQIRTINPEARVWTIEPGEYFLASLKRGVIYPGRTIHERFYSLSATFTRPAIMEDCIDASHMDYRMLNRAISEKIKAGARQVDIINVRGQRYIGVGLDSTVRLKIFGTPGNCLANLNKSLEIEVFGNVQDDVGDVMTGGRVIIHGDARDVLAQALQGGVIYVKGNAGNRCGIQMREYRDRRPVLMIGGRVDDYLGEYMAGGVIIILGLNYLDTDVEIVGDCVASGMVGGTIYIRGKVSPGKIGLNPPRGDVIQYLRGLVLDGRLSIEEYEAIESLEDFTLDTLREMLPPEVVKHVSKLYLNKYWKELVVEYRRLNDSDMAMIGPHFEEFGKVFDLRKEIDRVVKEEYFTVIRPKPAAATRVEEPEEG